MSDVRRILQEPPNSADLFGGFRVRRIVELSTNDDALNARALNMDSLFIRLMVK